MKNPLISIQGWFVCNFFLHFLFKLTKKKQTQRFPLSFCFLHLEIPKIKKKIKSHISIQSSTKSILFRIYKNE